MRVKLLKALPTVTCATWATRPSDKRDTPRVGDVIEACTISPPNRHGVYHGGNLYVVEENPDFFEVITWKPDVGHTYYFISADMLVESRQHFYTTTLYSNNYFKTEADAQEVLALLRKFLEYHKKKMKY